MAWTAEDSARMRAKLEELGELTKKLNKKRADLWLFDKAPKVPGARILAWNREERRWEPLTWRYHEHLGKFFWGGDFLEAAEGCEDEWISVYSHWKPMPAPPKGVR